jgi:hypothetical protein
MKKKLIDYIIEIYPVNFKTVPDFLNDIKSRSPKDQVDILVYVLLCVEGMESNENNDKNEKYLIEHIGEMDDVNYYNVQDFLKELEYNSDQRRVDILVERFLYIDSNI